MQTFLYFAYGSNVLTERLQTRCLSARVHGLAVATGYSLEVIKRSKDKSGKATLVKSTQPGVKSTQPGQQVFGVLFEIENGDRSALDKAEGKGSGYDRIDDFIVNMLPDMTQAQVTTYLASCSAVDDGLKPYDWYLALVIAGALQHNLPHTRIARLRKVAYIEDPVSTRKERVEAEKALKIAGWPDYKQILSPSRMG